MSIDDWDENDNLDADFEEENVPGFSGFEDADEFPEESDDTDFPDYGDMDTYSSTDEFGNSEDFSNGFRIDDGTPLTETEEAASQEAMEFAHTEATLGMGEALKELNPGRNVSPDEALEGMGSTEAFQQDYISRLAPNKQLIAQKMLRGQIHGSTPAQQRNIEESVKAFEALTRTSGVDFASRMDVRAASPVTYIETEGYEVAGTFWDEDANRLRKSNKGMRYDPKTGKYHEPIDSSPVSATPVDTSGAWKEDYVVPEAEVNQMASFLMNTTGEKLDLGPGGGLLSHTGSSKKDQKYQDNLDKAWEMLGEIVDTRYLTDRTVASDIYGLRKEQVTNEILSYLLNTDLAQQKDHIMPLPNELSTPGLRPTQALSGNNTAAWTTWQSIEELDKRGFESQHDLDYTNDYQRAIAQKIGSVRNTLSPINWNAYDTTEEAVEAGKEAWSEFKDDIFFIRDTLRIDGVTSLDENWGNRMKMGSGLTVVDEYMAAQNFRDYYSTELGSSGALGEYAGDELTGGGGEDGSITGVGTGGSGGQHAPTLAPTLPPYMDVKATLEYIEDVERIKNFGAEGRVPKHDEDGVFNKDFDSGKGGNEGRAGMHGAKELSEQETAVQAAVERFKELTKRGGLGADEAIAVITEQERPLTKGNEPSVPGTDRDDYLYSVKDLTDYKQGSENWLKQREGNVSASVAGTLMMGMGAERMAAQLARKRMVREMPEGEAKELAKLEDDISNAYTVMGTNYEEKVLRTFLASEAGEGLTFEEAYFTQGTGNNAGMGATPDGHLFYEDGSSAGLLELKFLGEGGMKKAVETYTAQIQMQMLITGEERTTLFALDRETNEWESQVFVANSVYQDQLRKLSGQAHDMSERITTDEELLMAKARYKGARKGGGMPKQTLGQSQSIDMAVEPEAPMTMFNINSTDVKTERLSYGDTRDESMVGAGGSQFETGKDQADRRKAADLGYDKVQDMWDDDMNEDHQAALAENAAANEEAAQASRQVAQEFKNLAGAAKDVVVGLAAIAGRASDSAMDTERAANLAGVDTNRARAMEFELVTAGGMTNQMALGTIGKAGEQNRLLTADTSRGKAYADMQVAVSANHLPVDLLEIDAYRDQTADQLLQWQMDQVNKGTSDKEAAQIAKAVGNPGLAIAYSGSVTGDSLKGSGSFDSEGARAAYAGYYGVDQLAQTTAEGLVAAGGELGGQAAAVVDIAKDNSGLLAAGKELSMAAAALMASAVAISGGGGAGGKVAGFFKKAGVAGITGLAAAYVGDAAYEAVADTDVGQGFSDALGVGIDGVMGAFGNEDALERLRTYKISQEFDPGYQPSHDMASPTQVNVENHVTVDEDGLTIKQKVNGEEDYVSTIDLWGQ